MTKYAATFADHIVTRNSDREYSHAWLVTEDGRIYDRGFSKSKDLAEKAARAPISRLGMGAKARRMPFSYKNAAKQAGFSNVTAWMDSIDEKAVKRTATMITEIVAVERS
jgi:hypothetical protein